MSVPHLLWFVAAEGAALDQLTGRVTAFNILDTVAVSQLPSRLMRLTCVATYELASGAPGLLLERIRVEDSAGDPTAGGESSTEVRFASGVITHRSVHILWNIDLRTEGTYRIKLQTRQAEATDWETRADLPLTVHVQAHPILNQKLG